MGLFPEGATPEGIHDLAGNVWEWVADWYAEYPKGTQRNPVGPERGESGCCAGRVDQRSVVPARGDPFRNVPGALYRVSLCPGIAFPLTLFPFSFTPGRSPGRMLPARFERLTLRLFFRLRPFVRLRSRDARHYCHVQSENIREIVAPQHFRGGRCVWNRCSCGGSQLLFVHTA